MGTLFETLISLPADGYVRFSLFGLGLLIIFVYAGINRGCGHSPLVTSTIAFCAIPDEIGVVGRKFGGMTFGTCNIPALVGAVVYS